MLVEAPRTNRNHLNAIINAFAVILHAHLVRKTTLFFLQENSGKWQGKCGLQPCVAQLDGISIQWRDRTSIDIPCRQSPAFVSNFSSRYVREIGFDLALQPAASFASQKNAG